MFIRPTTDVSDAEGARLQSQFESLRTRAVNAGDRPGVVRGVESARALYENASTPEERKIRDTANEFVSILYGLLFKQMEQTVDRSGFLDGGKTEEMFRSFTLDEYAKKASAQNSNPLAHRVYEMLYEASAARRSMQGGNGAANGGNGSGAAASGDAAPSEDGAPAPGRPSIFGEFHA